MFRQTDLAFIAAVIAIPVIGASVAMHAAKAQVKPALPKCTYTQQETLRACGESFIELFRDQGGIGRSYEQYARDTPVCVIISEAAFKACLKE